MDLNTILEVHAQLADTTKGIWRVVDVLDELGYHVRLEHKKTSRRRDVQIHTDGTVTVSILAKG